MAINNVNSNNMNNIYNSIFGTGTDKSTSSSFSLGDYAMIKNGTYKKLMKAYYATTDEDAEGSSATEEEKKKESITMTNIKNNAAGLNNSLEDLKSRSLYESTGVDEDGNKTYDRDKVIKNVKSFVDDYNAYIKSSIDTDNEAILRKSLKMTKITSKNSKLLSEVGITIGENNTLSIDEDKLKEARMTTLSSLFTDSGSYGDQIHQAARQSYQLANSAIYASSHSASYNVNGGYSMMGARSILDKYL